LIYLLTKRHEPLPGLGKNMAAAQLGIISLKMTLFEGDRRKNSSGKKEGMFCREHIW
jgi:hypothetical protein